MMLRLCRMCRLSELGRERVRTMIRGGFHVCIRPIADIIGAGDIRMMRKLLLAVLMLTSSIRALACSPDGELPIPTNIELIERE